MGTKYFNSFVLEIKLYHYKGIVDLHYKLLNILSLICYNSDSDYYCLCNKYHGCKKNYYLGRDLCALCCIKIYFRQDLINFKDYLDRNQFNLLKVKSYAFELYPFFIGMLLGGHKVLGSFFGRLCLVLLRPIHQSKTQT